MDQEQLTLLALRKILSAADDERPFPATLRQAQIVAGLISRAVGNADRKKRLQVISFLVGHQVDSSLELSWGEASCLIRFLKQRNSWKIDPYAQQVIEWAVSYLHQSSEVVES